MSHSSTVLQGRDGSLASVNTNVQSQHISPAEILCNPRVSPSKGSGSLANLNDRSEAEGIRRKSDAEMVNDYWKKVKAKFGKMAERHFTSNQTSISNASHLRQRSFSPYDVEE